jgi:hypothetical protein
VVEELSKLEHEVYRTLTLARVLRDELNARQMADASLSVPDLSALVELITDRLSNHYATLVRVELPRKVKAVA